MKKKLAALLCILLVLAGVPSLASAPYTQSSPQLYTMAYRYTVVNRSSEAATNIRVIIPSIHPVAFSNQEVLATSIKPAPSVSSQDARGSVSVEVVIPRLAAGARTEIVLQHVVRNYAVSFDLASPAGPFPAPHSSYLQPEDKIESSHSEIRAKASEVTGGKQGIEAARAIYAFVQQYMTYGGTSRNQGALSALRTRTGVCEDYSSLFVALCRAVGIPARVVFGEMYDDSGRLQGHAWVEFFLATHGWVPADPTIISSQVPWSYFANIASDKRRFPYSLATTTWKYSWSGGSINITQSSDLKAGQLIPLFSDVTAQWEWARKAIEDLSLRGIISGYAGRFNPAGTLTRAEFAKLIVLARGLSPAYGPSPFIDVKQSDWFHPYVLAATQAGLFSGTGGSSFQPHSPISREQIAMVLARSLGFDSNAKGEVTLPFSDKGMISPWALTSVRFCVERGLITGYGDNTFRPHNYCNRAEAAVLLQRFLGI